MQEKLLKILNIKVEAINRNIDNLNYLNGELEKNNSDLDYINEKISLFKESDILNFDKITKEDFEHVLSMIDPSIRDIFKNKTCNYDGIIYIIQGIRKSISLQLTSDQTSAIYNFIEGMKQKAINLKETIHNLTESRERLPETDLMVLTGNLENYQNIISKFENNLYLTEIDDIRESLDFANVTIEEKADIFEYVLKYNADIYSSIKNDDDFKDITNKDTFKFDFPKFDYEPVNVSYEPFSPDTENETKTEDLSLEDVKLNLENYQEEPYQNEINNSINEPIEIPIIDNDNEIPELNTKLDDNLEDSENNSSKEIEDTKELNTIELEDIIKKIDEKLKELEEEKDNAIALTTPDDDIPVSHDDILNENIERNVLNENSLINEICEKYNLSNLNIQNSNTSDVDQMLNILNQYNLLEELKRNKEVLEMILSNNSSSQIEELITLIKENFVVKSDELNDILKIIVETMPILFTNNLVMDSLKKNIEFFKEKKINLINLFDNYREVLIMNHDVLIENYNKVSLYKIDINNDNVKYVLYNKNILTNLDSYIEAIAYEKGFLGHEDYFDGLEYVKKYPYKLNSINRDMLMKLRFTSENGGKIYGNKPGVISGEISNSKVDTLSLEPEYTDTYFNLKYDFIGQDEMLKLKEEIKNLKEFDMTLDGNINKLDSNYKKSELKYKIGNIVLSRIKTIRLYNFLKTKMSLKDALLIALTYNTVIKNNEYQKVVDIVESIVGGN